ncbi:MAG: HAD-IC family P-type ATPase, partial [Patescibacteria group bacterium]|nr:HAD-IC family P-type ATPase [Patescibacteria group bacterium]
KAIVLREGKKQEIDANELVVGDIIFLKAGDKVPTDGRIIKANELKANEMVLTGEWLSSNKTTKNLDENVPLADRDNMVYMGTVIENGFGKAIVTATGVATEIGKIAALVKKTKERRTPFQRKIARLSKFLGAGIAFICSLILFEGLLSGKLFEEMFAVSVALAVSAIPEGLLPAITIILVIGMKKVLKKKGLISKLSATETLGGINVICTDKTGTLTSGNMVVSQILTPSQIFKKKCFGKTDDARTLILKITTFCNEAFIENPDEEMKKWIIRGKPTDKALLLAGIEAGINSKEFEQKIEKIAELPFNSENKFLAFLFKKNKKENTLYVSGAAEKVLFFSNYLKIGKRKKKISSRERQIINLKLENLTKKGLRVIAVAYKDIPSRLKIPKKMEYMANDLIFSGLVAMKDPLRKETKKAIKTCINAGIKPIMITGDHLLTAKAIAKEIGLKTNRKNVIIGNSLDELSENEFQNRVEDIEIYARVEPRHKSRIIEAWQTKGKIVAMTGDGINDAPALKRADIGISMASGTDVAKGTSEMILLDNNFNTIIGAIREGRICFDNIRKVVIYLISDDFSEIFFILTSLFFGLPLPLLPAQILWINVVEDGLPDIALTLESGEREAMSELPRRSNEDILNHPIKIWMFLVALITGIFGILSFFFFWKITCDLTKARSFLLAITSLDSLFFAFSCRSLRHTIWRKNILSNLYLTFSIAIGIVLIFLALNLPILQQILKTVPLSAMQWFMVLGIVSIEIFLIEKAKLKFIIKKQS